MKPRLKHALFVAPILIVAILLAGTAVGAGTGVTLTIKREYAHRHTTACHKTKSWRLFHRSGTVEYTGLVTPPPSSSFSVRLEVKRCVAGNWHKIADRFTVGQARTGEYKGFFKASPLAPRSHKARAIVFYKARAIINGFPRSRYEYFAVTN